jgi:hypothetical protein
MDDADKDEPLPGPRGKRMQALGILTKGQKVAPIIPDIKTNAEGKPNAGDLEKAKHASILGQKIDARKAALLRAGNTNTVPEQDPMKSSTQYR